MITDKNFNIKTICRKCHKEKMRERRKMGT